MDNAKELKIAAARQALTFVEDGMRLGIGTGTTAEEFIRLLAGRVRSGLNIVGVATSERTDSLCRELGITMTSLDETPQLDLTVDGADEVDASLDLIKGGGGALLREKTVAAASDSMLVIADQTKFVETLGRFALPIEVNRFGLAATMLAIERAAHKSGLAGRLALRVKDNAAFVTDGGHFIVDASFGRIPNPQTLSDALFAVPGVVEHGLFLGLARAAVIAGPDGIRTMNRS